MLSNNESILFLGDVVPYKPFKFNNNYKTIINLECPITKEGSPAIDKINLRVKENYLPNIFGTNLLCASLGNNHILDFGQKGLQSTLAELSLLKAGWFGLNDGSDDGHQPLILEFHTLKIALFSVVCQSTSPVIELNNQTHLSLLEVDKIIERVTQTRKSVQRIVIYLHWGIEESSYPSKENIYVARKLIEAGVDIVIGSHAHAPQPVEKYKGGIIAYNLGNFMMPAMNNIPTYFDENGIAQSTFYKSLMLWNKISWGLLINMISYEYSIKKYIFLLDRIIELPFTPLDKYLNLKNDRDEETYNMIVNEHLKKRAFARRVKYFFYKPHIPEKLKRKL
jgi:hypothetical protein